MSLPALDTPEGQALLSVLRALDLVAERAGRFPFYNCASAAASVRTEVVRAWKGARTPRERRAVVLAGVELGERIKPRNAGPVQTADVLRAKLAETAQAVEAKLPASDHYPTAQAAEIYHATLELLGQVWRLMQKGLRPGDTQDWTDVVQKLQAGLWRQWDKDMPRYRIPVVTAEQAGAAEVRFPDAGFKLAILRQLRNVHDGLTNLDKVSKFKGWINDDGALYKALDFTNRVLHAAGGGVKEALGIAAGAAGDALHATAGALGIPSALMWSGVLVGGGLLLLAVAGHR